ncbi:71_t:CDS:2 [Paraglomus brasilianum]|uniref:71_t:CDS:1 n=1 Tax=Paraglomus brasilianum TaxID=144538 RepID=A0A9N9G4R3_9GLOM|nr:71_t:CDS:2 [Paraglomus brasilianum]
MDVNHHRMVVNHILVGLSHRIAVVNNHRILSKIVQAISSRGCVGGAAAMDAAGAEVSPKGSRSAPRGTRKKETIDLFGDSWRR